MNPFNLNEIEIMAMHDYGLCLGTPALFTADAYTRILQEAIEYSNNAMYGDMYECPEDYGYDDGSHDNI